MENILKMDLEDWERHGSYLAPMQEWCCWVKVYHVVCFKKRTHDLDNTYADSGFFSFYLSLFGYHSFKIISIAMELFLFPYFIILHISPQWGFKAANIIIPSSILSSQQFWEVI